MTNYLSLANRLHDAGEPFVVATVVRCEPPASARPGAKAIIRADGSMEGWVGGSCAETLVIGEARKALADGKPRLLRLSPNPGEGGTRPDLVEYLMTCHSGGTLEIFLDPALPSPRLLLAGETPIARTLAALGHTLGYRVETIHPDATGQIAISAATGRSFIVIATMGTFDEEALETALQTNAEYVALVASPKRAAVMRDYLLARGLPPETLTKLHAPAGLNLGGQSPEEIALSIMAEIASLRATTPGLPVESPSPPASPDEAIDPICGMSVTVADARHVADHDGARYYFCCPACKRAFEKEPARYLAGAQPYSSPH